MTRQTLIINYSADGLRKIDVPSQAVDPGETVRVYLWGRSAEDLSGCRLDLGADTLGPGKLRQYPGQTEEKYFELMGENSPQDFDWPALSLARAEAYGNLYAVDGNDVSLVALAGEDVTRLFKLSGNSLIRCPEPLAPLLTGTVRAVANRSPWCREWEWVVPGVPASGSREGGGCGWTVSELDFVFGDDLALIGMFRACALGGGELVAWADESGLGNNLSLSKPGYSEDSPLLRSAKATGGVLRLSLDYEG